MKTPAQFRDWALPAGTQLTASEAASLALGYFTVGLTVAVLHITDSTSPQVMVASIFLMNAVTPTLAFTAVTASGGTAASGVLSGWLVSTRFGLVAAAIAPRMWPHEPRLGRKSVLEASRPRFLTCGDRVFIRSQPKARIATDFACLDTTSPSGQRLRRTMSANTATQTPGPHHHLERTATPRQNSRRALGPVTITVGSSPARPSTALFTDL